MWGGEGERELEFVLSLSEVEWVRNKMFIGKGIKNFVCLCILGGLGVL